MAILFRIQTRKRTKFHSDMSKSQFNELDSRSICDLFAATKEQDRILFALNSISEDVGKAKAIRELASDRRKQILSRIVGPMVEAGESVAGAEMKARAGVVYKQMLDEHFADLSKAESILAKWEVLKVQADAIRTTISAQRALVEMQ